MHSVYVIRYIDHHNSLIMKMQLICVWVRACVENNYGIMFIINNTEYKS